MREPETQKRLVDATAVLTAQALADKAAGKATGKFQITYAFFAGEIREVGINDQTTIRPEDL